MSGRTRAARRVMMYTTLATLIRSTHHPSPAPMPNDGPIACDTGCNDMLRDHAQARPL